MYKIISPDAEATLKSLKPQPRRNLYKFFLPKPKRVDKVGRVATTAARTERKPKILPTRLLLRKNQASTAKSVASKELTKVEVFIKLDFMFHVEQLNAFKLAL